MTASFRLPFAASVAGHVVVVALMILVAQRLPPIALQVPAPRPAIEIMLAPPPPVVEPPPEPPPIPEAEPPPRVAEPEPPPPIVNAEPPPPPPRPKPTPRPKPAPRPPPHPASPHPTPTQPPVQTALVPVPPRPPPAPAPVVSASYRALLSSWLERHKRYPASARERGEEGQAVLKFHVDRAGRVLSFSIVESTGHPDLDAALDQMMRGASLPPFPADMTATDVEVTVALRFAMER